MKSFDSEKSKGRQFEKMSSVFFHVNKNVKLYSLELLVNT